MAKGYTTKEDIENYMLINIDDSFDEQIEKWIEAAEAIVDHKTSRDFTPVAVDAVAEDRTFDGTLTDSLRIDPCTEVEEVRFSETADPISESSYVLYPVRKPTINQIVLRYLKFPKGLQNIYVKAIWGFATVPADIQFATTVLVAGIINNAWQSEGEVQSMTIGRYSVSYKTQEQVDDFKRVTEMLDSNKLYTF